jgi:hypothetical protein
MEELNPVARYFTAALTGLDPLVGTSVHGEALNDDATYPAYRFAHITGPRILAVGAEVQAAEPLYLITAHGRSDLISPADLTAVAARIEGAVTTNASVLQDGLLIDCWPDPMGTYQDSEYIDGLRYDCVGAFYRVFVQPA